MAKKNPIPPMEQPAKKPRVLAITKQQVEGIKARMAQMQAAQAELNTYLSGVVAGHGYDATQITEMDDVKRTLTIQPQ